LGKTIAEETVHEEALKIDEMDEHLFKCKDIDLPKETHTVN